MSTKKTVLIATPTWNRKDILRLTAEALQASDLRLDTTDYIISDDASTEFTEDELKTMFPWADIIRHRQKHTHPLLNTHFCFDTFLQGTYDTLVILDSDMIVAPDWRRRLDELTATPGFTIGSLYNSTHHVSSEDHGTYLIKASAGFAGMVFSRGLLHTLKGLLGKSFDDWRVCHTVGKKFHVSKPSALAHIGINGQWNGNDYSTLDKAADFDWNSVDPEIKAGCELLLRVSL